MEDPEKCRSLVCDASGIIIAEMVYRCMICHYVTDNIQEAKNHYQSLHMHDEDDEEADSQHGAHGGVGHHHNNHNSHHPSIKQVPSSTESMLSKDKAHVNRSLQQQRKSINNSLTNNNNNNNNNNPLVPDISLYEDESPKSYRATPDNSALNLSSSAGGAVAANNGSSTKSGYVTCAVCNVTRYYSCVQRRYGQFTCVTCYRYFRTFLLKPKRYACPSLGECALNVRTRCRACWIKACISVFSVDARRQQVIQANLPVKRAGSIKIPPDGIPQNLSIGNYSASENGDHDAADSPLSLPVKVEMGDDGMDMLEARGVAH
ncbi:hypothetical protein HDE_02011 [Halotydeus destructor]|nr:hypothetical protein HDE_02011 [Halotydeus destructor]